MSVREVLRERFSRQLFAQAQDFLVLLDDLGVVSVADFLTLRKRSIISRFGALAHCVYAALEGESFQPLPPPQRDLRIVVARDFDPPVGNFDQLAFLGRELCHCLLAELDARERTADRVLLAVTIGHEDEDMATAAHYQAAWHIASPTLKELADRMRWQLEAWLAAAARDANQASHGGGGGQLEKDSESFDAGDARLYGVLQIELTIEQPLPLGDAQQALWGADGIGGKTTPWGSGQAAARKAARAVTALQTIAGLDAVQLYQPRSAPDPTRDANIVSIENEAEQDHSQARSAAPPWPGHIPYPWPACVSQPQPIQLFCSAGHECSVDSLGILRCAAGCAAPVQLQYVQLAAGASGKSCRQAGSEVVTGYAGPWLRSEAWWQPKGERGRAWLQLVTASGKAWLCMYSEIDAAGAAGGVASQDKRFISGPVWQWQIVGRYV